MRPINNWNDVKPMTMGDFAKLPAGGYVCKIKQAKVEQKQRQDQTTYEMLCIAFDIYEGEYSGFFEDQFRESTYSDKKWKGVIRQMLPSDDGTEKDNRIKGFFKGAITAIEESNPGYHFNFDERTLSDKLVGVIFREEEYDINGRNGMAVKPFVLTDIHKILSGEFTVPAPKMINREQSSTANPFPSQTYQGFPPSNIDVIPNQSAYIPSQPANFVPLPTDEDLPF
jgi:hypothetical protein